MSNEPIHPNLEDIAKHHLGESDWYQMRAKDAEHPIQIKLLHDKAEWHLRAAAEILTAKSATDNHDKLVSELNKIREKFKKLEIAVSMWRINKEGNKLLGIFDSIEPEPSMSQYIYAEILTHAPKKDGV